jgi:hypothetical protein
LVIEFNCPHCDKLLRTGDDKAGLAAKCPGCGEPLRVPLAEEDRHEDEEFDFEPSDLPPAPAATRPPPRAASEATKTCPMCGEEIPAAAVRCRSCGEDLQVGARQGWGEVPIRIDAGEVISTSWSIYKSQMGLCIGGVMTVLVLGSLAGIPAEMVSDDDHLLRALLGIFSNLIGMYLNLGQNILLLRIARGENAEFSDIFSGGKYFLRMVGNSIVFGIVVGFGILLCVIPGIIFSLMYWPFAYVLVDTDARGLGPLERAKTITSGNWGAVFLLGLATIGLMFAGLLAVGVGLIFTIPFALVLFAVAYCRMTGQQTAHV